MEGSKSAGDPNPRLYVVGPGHTNKYKRIRFCDQILCKVLRYSFAESSSLCRVVTLRSYIGGVSRSERGLTALSQVSARPHGVADKLKINKKHGVEIVTSTGM